jgi:uncharacterized protein YjbI with pentapeptide repeats/beta-lactamase regulating signal transducer with metallopeptidase domain
VIEAIVSAALPAIVLGIVLGAVLFAGVILLVRFLPLRAAARHAVWTIALVTTALIPIASLGASAARTAAPLQPRTVVLHAVRTPSKTSRQRSGVPAQSQTVIAPPPRISFAMPALRVHLTRVAALAIAAVWLAGVVAGLAGLVISLIRVGGLKKRSSPLDSDLADDLPWLTENHAREREIYLRLSYETETPVAIGFGRPVILIPTELASHSGLAAIDQLIRHEHAHLRRYDDWTNLLQRVIERIFWFNPIVWLVGARIALEREIASDDAVVDETGHAAEYAKSLWQLAREMRMPEHAVVAPGALLTRKQISIRIESLLENRPTMSALTPAASTGVAALAIACVIIAGANAPAFELPAPVATVPAASPVAKGVPAPHPPHAIRPAVVSAHAPQRSVHVSVVASPPAVTKHVAHAAAPWPAPHAEPPLPPEARDVIAATPEKVSRAVSQAMSESTFASPPPGSAGSSTLYQMLSKCIGCDLSRHDLRGADLRNLKLTAADLSGADLRNARLDGVVFTGVDLSGVKLDGASLTNAHFIGVDISGISFRGAHITGLTMTGVSLSGMDFRGLDARALIDACTGCDLAHANLSNLDLHGVRFVGADLAHADLEGANLSGAQFDGADLSHANLHNADLRNASFRGASLAGANLQGANTTGAHFFGIDLTGVHVP